MPAPSKPPLPAVPLGPAAYAPYGGWATLLLAGLGILCFGCAISTIRSGGFSVARLETEDAFATVRLRATIELGCPGENLSPTVTAVGRNSFGARVPREISLQGCGRWLFYSLVPDRGWVLTSNTRLESPGRRPVPAAPSGP